MHKTEKTKKPTAEGHTWAGSRAVPANPVPAVEVNQFIEIQAEYEYCEQCGRKQLIDVEYTMQYNPATNKVETVGCRAICHKCKEW